MIDEILKDAATRMQKSVESLKTELAKVRTGRAHPSLLEHITVDYYGSDVPLSQVSNIGVEDARTLLNEGDEIEAKFIGVDKKTKSISLSIKAKDNDDEASAMKDYGQQANAGSATLGDIFKQLEK